MAVNKDSNAYTITFAIILVIIVGGLLAFISNGLKPLQDKNLKNEKKQYILNCLPGNKLISRDQAGTEFANYVKERVILNYNGEQLENTFMNSDQSLDDKNPNDAYSIDLLKEYKTISKKEDRNYPLFICEVKGEKYYVAPVMGKGLWAAVWGYIALDENGEKIAGAVFDHKSETPGLGAEISQDFFEDQFIGKLISSENGYKPIEVNKPGSPLNDYQVDGISGGTFTSVGVEEMMERTLSVYQKYIKNLNRS